MYDYKKNKVEVKCNDCEATMWIHRKRFLELETRKHVFRCPCCVVKKLEKEEQERKNAGLCKILFWCKGGATRLHEAQSVGALLCPQKIALRVAREIEYFKVSDILRKKIGREPRSGHGVHINYPSGRNRRIDFEDYNDTYNNECIVFENSKKLTEENVKIIELV